MVLRPRDMTATIKAPTIRTVPMTAALSAMAVATAPMIPSMALRMELRMSLMLGGVDVFMHQVRFKRPGLYIHVEQKCQQSYKWIIGMHLRWLG